LHGTIAHMDSPAEATDKRLRVVTTASSGARTVLLTADGVRIEAAHLPRQGPPRPGPEPLAIVVAHGFTGSLDRAAVRRAAAHLSAYGGVFTFSFRGHGRSGGDSTVGDLEVHDVDAVIRWARKLGYRRVATVGFSMGASVVLRQAGGAYEGVEEVDAVVAVSSPARWYYRGTAPMRRVHWAITRPAGRLVSRIGLKTRIRAAEWNPVPLSPVESVPHIAPTPLLIVHGDRDGYFPLDHPYSLAAAAGEGAAELWIEPGFGHAEDAAGPVLLARIGDWLTACVPGIPGI
jgi:pimeloyl-ACP methyl ester carboxylesterase